MTNQHKDKSSNTAAATVAGAVIGAAATAAAIALSDKNNRQKLGKQMQQLKQSSQKALQSLKTTADKTAKVVEAKIDDIKDSAMLDEATESPKSPPRHKQTID